jgi:hypothetical protein
MAYSSSDICTGYDKKGDSKNATRNVARSPVGSVNSEIIVLVRARRSLFDINEGNN